MKIITPKGLAKTTAKSTGIALTQNYKSGHSKSTENIYHAMIAPIPKSTSSNDDEQPSTSGLKNDIIKKEQ